MAFTLKPFKPQTINPQPDPPPPPHPARDAWGMDLYFGDTPANSQDATSFVDDNGGLDYHKSVLPVRVVWLRL